MKKITTQTFKHTIRDIHKHTENRKFCFVLGSGASVKSGIPAGATLAKDWFNEIKLRYSKEEFERWLKEAKIIKKDLGSSYGSIYRKRFENDKTSGYEFLVQEMQDAKPSFGHIVLAQILSKTNGHCVLTTNFDSLVETAIYQFTDKTPLVCGHESLSGYARPSEIHPLVVKIHRDLLLSPKSDPDEINELDKGWKEPLDNIFSSHIPIVIGYGGNDESLMNYFNQMNKPSNFFWCGRKGSKLSKKVENLIQTMDGKYVEIEGFDELMHELLWVFDEIKPIDEELEEISRKRIETAKHELFEITKIKGLSSGKEISAFEYAELAEAEPNLEKRKEIYLEALEKFPETDWLWNEFTYFLQREKKDYKELDTYYKKALEINPNNSNNNGNYAIFLHNIKKDFDKAEVYYIKALEIEPNHANNNENYANFLFNIKKDFDKAQFHFKKALEIEPNNADFNGNYSQFLFIEKRVLQAKRYWENALKFNKEEKIDLLIELWFYKYAHCFEENIDEIDSKIEELLNEGLKSIDWSLDENIKIAIEQGHPNPERLKEFAKRITSKEALSS